MADEKPVYCMHCNNWYATTKCNQCDIGKTEKEGLSLSIAGFEALVSQNIYGKPSELNKDNNCLHYKALGLFGKLSRRIFYGIPLKPTVEAKVK